MKHMWFLLLSLSVIILIAMVLIGTKQLSKLVNFEGFDSENTYKLVYYKKADCHYCEQFDPEWRKLDQCIGNFLQVDGRNCALNLTRESKNVMGNTQDIERFNINGVPEVILIKPNNEFVTYRGNMSANNIVAWLNTLLPCRITCSV